MRKVIERLGPAYVKVAQAVSTRVDVLDMSYLLEIERLQDRVPPFPTEAALLVMAEGQYLDIPVRNIWPDAQLSLSVPCWAACDAYYFSTGVTTCAMLSYGWTAWFERSSRQASLHQHTNSAVSQHKQNKLASQSQL